MITALKMTSVKMSVREYIWKEELNNKNQIKGKLWVESTQRPRHDS